MLILFLIGLDVRRRLIKRRLLEAQVEPKVEEEKSTDD
jgi:hypothetical protein